MKLNIQLFAASKSTTFTESNLSTANNTSTLKITIYFSANNTSTWFSSETLYCTCNGVTKSANVAHSKGGSVTKSFTFDNIAHNSDGTKSVSWSWNCNTGTQGLGNISDSGTKTLTRINRQSMFDTTGWDQNTPVDLDDPIEFKITQYLNNVYHKLTAYIMDSNETLQSVAVRDNISIVNGKYSLTFTQSELENNVYPLITSSSTKFIRVYLRTYTDSELTQQLGDDSIIWYTGQVPSTVVPSVSIGTLTEADTTMISKNWGVFVQNKSKLNIPITATGAFGSTIQSIVTTINGINFTGSPVVTSTLVTSGTNTITTTVTDSRGYTATDTKTYTVVPYSNPNIQIAQVQRCDSNGVVTDNGTYLLYDFKGSISDVDNNNTALFRLGYKKTSDVAYTYVTISTNYSVNLSDQVSSFTINQDYEYDVIFEASDAFMTSSISRGIDTGFDLMNFNASGKSMAIGRVSSRTSTEKVLDIALDTVFEKSLTLSNDAKEALLGMVYPVGAVYISTISTSPATLFGFGTWSQIDGYYLYAGNTYSETTATGTGTQSHTLTTDEIPAHTHGSKSLTGKWENDQARFPGDNSTSGIVSAINKSITGYWGETGGSANNMVGFQVNATHEHNSVGGGDGHTHDIATVQVYVWKRTA